jgi:hypothetical protein
MGLVLHAQFSKGTLLVVRDRLGADPEPTGDLIGG